MKMMASTKKFAPDVRYVPLTDPFTCPLDEASICCSTSTDFPFSLLSSTDLCDTNDFEDLTDDLELVRLRFPVMNGISSVSPTAGSSDIRSDAKSMPLFDRSFGSPCISTLPCKLFVRDFSLDWEDKIKLENLILHLS